MAMSESSLATRLRDNYNALGIAPPSDQQMAVLEAVAGAIIDEITENAVVTTEVTSGSSAGTYEGSIE